MEVAPGVFQHPPPDTTVFTGCPASQGAWITLTADRAPGLQQPTRQRSDEDAPKAATRAATSVDRPSVRGGIQVPDQILARRPGDGAATVPERWEHYSYAALG